MILLPFTMKPQFLYLMGYAEIPLYRDSWAAHKDFAEATGRAASTHVAEATPLDPEVNVDLRLVTFCVRLWSYRSGSLSRLYRA